MKNKNQGKSRTFFPTFRKNFPALRKKTGKYEHEEPEYDIEELEWEFMKTRELKIVESFPASRKKILEITRIWKIGIKEIMKIMVFLGNLWESHSAFYKNTSFSGNLAVYVFWLALVGLLKTLGFYTALSDLSTHCAMSEACFQYPSNGFCFQVCLLYECEDQDYLNISCGYFEKTLEKQTPMKMKISLNLFSTILG